jgi:GxxExxY protein
MEVHRHFGCGFLEPVYQEALAVELAIRNIPFLREEKLTLTYKGRALETTYKPDFICFNAVLVELKALSRMSGTERRK